MRARRRKTDPMREVVGTLFGGVIYPHALSQGEPAIRARVQFMVACDLGTKWEALAKWPTLYLLVKS